MGNEGGSTWHRSQYQFAKNALGVVLRQFTSSGMNASIRRKSRIFGTAGTAKTNLSPSSLLTRRSRQSLRSPNDSLRASSSDQPLPDFVYMVACGEIYASNRCDFLRAAYTKSELHWVARGADRTGATSIYRESAARISCLSLHTSIPMRSAVTRDRILKARPPGCRPSFPNGSFVAAHESGIGPSRHIALPPEAGRYRGKADIALVASRRRIYGYTA